MYSCNKFEEDCRRRSCRRSGSPSVESCGTSTARGDSMASVTLVTAVGHLHYRQAPSGTDYRAGRGERAPGLCCCRSGPA